MATIKDIVKEIDINASKEKVWSVLFDDATYRMWGAEFMEGSYAETDWQEGSKVRFMGPDQSGIFGRIIKHVPNEILTIEYDGELQKGGVEDTEGDSAKAFKGAHETYKVTTEGDITHLRVDAVMSEEYYDMMNVAWDSAMLKIKELSEK